MVKKAVCRLIPIRVRPFSTPRLKHAMRIAMYLARMICFHIILARPIIRQTDREKSWQNCMVN
jgi:hypothetical protein